MNRWMTVKDVAKYLQVSEEAIYKLAQRRRIPASKILSQWRFKKETIDQWAESLSNQKTKNRKSKG